MLLPGPWVWPVRSNLEVAKRENAVILYESLTTETRYAGLNSAESYGNLFRLQDKCLNGGRHASKLHWVQPGQKQHPQQVDQGVHQSSEDLPKSSADLGICIGSAVQARWN